MRSFYLLEESMCVIGEVGYFRPYATTEELHARLESKLGHFESMGRLLNNFLLGESVNVWTVQCGRLAAGLDVTEFVSVHLLDGATRTVSTHNQHRYDFSSRKRTDPPPADEGARLSLNWDGIIARLSPLMAPLASPGDEDLVVQLEGPHPAPDIDSYINELMESQADTDFPWFGVLNFGSSTSVP
ncbi:hypothetical protein [Actinoallomurus sp. CA-150999]|uniref:hypothetical protein n=1 Tax=Actinoallomurus sp. CA-150999 TaxID=3239887 RepID=UPI003D8FC8D9